MPYWFRRYFFFIWARTVPTEDLLDALTALDKASKRDLAWKTSKKDIETGRLRIAKELVRRRVIFWA